MSNLTDNPEDGIWCDKDGIAGEGKYEPATSNNPKPCPFCGAIPKLEKMQVFTNGENSPSYVKCPNCHVFIFRFGMNSDVLALGAWNERPEEDAQAGIIAVLELFRNDAKSIAEEAMTLLKEIAFHGSTPERRQRVIDDLRKIVSREDE